MGTSKYKNIELYRSLEELSIYRFDKCISGDLRYLSKEEDVTHIKISDAYNDVWKDLYNQYAEKTKNNITISIYLLIGEINYLKLRIYIVPELINILLNPISKDQFIYAIQEIRNWGYAIDDDEDLTIRLNKILEAVKNSKTKIKRKKEEYKELTKHNGKPLTIHQQRLKLERGLGIKINIHKDNVEYWLECWNELDRIIRLQRKKINSG